MKFSVRRLAAVDMYGLSGRAWRRRVIVAEFLVGALGCSGLGVASLLHPGAVSFALGVWLLGAGLNYVPLCVQALALLAPGRLDAELTGVDLMAELRFYSRAQFLIAVPLALPLLWAAELRQHS